MTVFAPTNSDPAPVLLHYVRGDRLPQIVAQIVDESDTPVDLTDYTATLAMRRLSGQHQLTTGWIERGAEITDAENGVVYYDVTRSDTNQYPGDFEFIIRIWDDGDLLLTAPTERDATVIIRDRPIPYGIFTLDDGTILIDGLSGLILTDGETDG